MRCAACVVAVVVAGLAACAHGWHSVVEARAAACSTGQRAVVAGVECRCVDVDIGCRGTPDPAPDATDNAGRMACASVDSDASAHCARERSELAQCPVLTDVFGCPVRRPVEQGACTPPATAGSAWGCPLLDNDGALQIWRCVDGHWTSAPEDCRGAM